MDAYGVRHYAIVVAGVVTLTIQPVSTSVWLYGTSMRRGEHLYSWQHVLWENEKQFISFHASAIIIILLNFGTSLPWTS